MPRRPLPPVPYHIAADTGTPHAVISPDEGDPFPVEAPDAGVFPDPLFGVHA